MLIILLAAAHLSHGYAQDKDKNISLSVDKFKLEPTGRIYVDVAKYFKDKTPLSSGAAFGDIRLGTKFSLGDKWGGKIEFGFAKSKISYKDIFLRYNFKESSYIRLGNYTEPIGLEYVDSSAGNKFVTSSSASQAFAGKRNLGFEYVGWSNKFWYAGGIFADSKMASGTNLGNQGYAFSARGVFNPLREEGKLLHIAAAGTYRKADAPGFQYDDNDNAIGELPRSISFSSNSETVVETRKFINSKVNKAKDQFKYNFEFIGSVGPLYTQMEYYNAHVRREESTLKSYNAEGAYGQVGFLATGGGYRYDKSWGRMLRPRPGSWEFLVRYSWVDLNDSKSEIYGGKQNDVSAAINYYYSKYLIFRLNYTNVGLDNKSLIGKERFNALSLRVQMIIN